MVIYATLSTCQLTFVRFQLNIFTPVLQAYLQQLHSTHGARLLPPAALAVLRSKACRSAIMFGDTLTPAQCNTLLSRLAATQVGMTVILACSVWCRALSHILPMS